MGLFDQPPRELQRFLEENRNLGQTERYRTASIAESYYQNIQYDHLSDWNSNRPIRKKKPAVIIPLYALAVNTLERFIWGGSRFPKVMVEPTRKDEDGPTPDEIGPRLYVDDAKKLSGYVNEMIRIAELQAAIREASLMAIISTSSAIVLGTRGGFLTAHAQLGKHCTPTFDPMNPRKLKKLEIMYQFQREEPNGQMGIIKRMYWYRRVIDEENDTVYKPVLILAGRNFDPDWEVDTELSIKHNLGFCPCQWIRTLPASTDSIDGRPIIDPALYALIDRLNYGVSQRDRAVEYFQDPQWVRKNVPRSERGGLTKNPGMMWDIPEDADVSILEAKGSGQDTAAKHLDELKNLFFESVGVVLSDPNRLRASSHISGVVLEYLHAPMMSLASDLRQDFGNAFISLINLGLRLCAKINERGEDVWIQNTNNAMELLRGSQLRGVWLDIPISLGWGTFFSPTVQEQQLKVAAATQAVVGGLVSKTTATEYIAPDFAIFDIDTERQAADKEAEERLAQEMQTNNQNQPTGGKSIGSSSAQSLAKAGDVSAKKITQPNRTPGKG